MKDRGVFEAAQSILADPRFRDIPNIQFYPEKACQTQNPEYSIKAYTVNGDFFEKINEALAKSKDLHVGTTYRGMLLNREYFETNYVVVCRFMIRPFTSTSKNREVAEIFAGTPAPAGEVSVLSMYTIPLSRS
jgi:hypothetical protein